MEIVNPWDYLKKYLHGNPTEEDYVKSRKKRDFFVYKESAFRINNKKRKYNKKLYHDKKTKD